jgi:dihydrodipicolinate synthase/N-acetylneuraminate lyase
LNSTASPVAQTRAQLLARLFPRGVPRLWCPTLTHYGAAGEIDAPRIAAHLRHLAPNVSSFLIPGSTGDGWTLSEAETRRLLDIAFDQAQELRLNLLIGVLKPDASSALDAISDIVDWLKSRTGETDPIAALTKARVSGFTVCPPRGSELAQDAIDAALATILSAGLPTALYQLPQVTQNEISPEVLAGLANRFPNFIFFKDTSGHDRAVLSGKSLGGVFAVRGAEGDYARWLNLGGGPYDGFLLSTANCFARELQQIIHDLAAGQSEAARQMSGRLTDVIKACFELVSTLPGGNPFGNANKAIDHFYAHGPRAISVPPPRLHAGLHLPAEAIRGTAEILARYDLMPAKGYLAGS